MSRCGRDEICLWKSDRNVMKGVDRLVRSAIVNGRRKLKNESKGIDNRIRHKLGCFCGLFVRRAGDEALLLQVLRTQDDVGEQSDGVAVPAASDWAGKRAPRALRGRGEGDLHLQVLRTQVVVDRIAYLVQVPAASRRRAEGPPRASAVGGGIIMEMKSFNLWELYL